MIFDKVGMKDTGYDLHDPLLQKRASGYAKTATGYTNAPYLDMSIPYAAGSLYSTVEDLYLWDRALYTDQLLRDDLKKQLFTPTLQEYGFGWVIRKAKLDDGKTEVGTIGHAGGINGFSTRIFRGPEDKELVVLLDNTSRGDKLNALASSIFSILHGIEPREPRKSIVDELRQGTSGAAIVARYRELRKASPDEYDFQESDLNTLGYSMLAKGRADDAIEIFKLNVEMYPQAANPYDKIGRAHV